MSHKSINAEQLASWLIDHHGWKMAHGHLTKEFKFDDFKQAFVFMTKVADEAERLNHHPNWSNAYNRVSFELWTHETGGVTEHDLELAEAISGLAEA